MDIITLIFNTTIPPLGFRVISAIHYLAIGAVAAVHFRNYSDIKFRTRIAGCLFFIIFIIMLVDWSWSFAEQSRWRSYIPPTGETPWLTFQPTPFGSNITHDFIRWPEYIVGFLFAIDFLHPFFKKKIMSLNKFVVVTFTVYFGFWLSAVWLAPNPLYVDVGLWNLWPMLASQTGPVVHLQTFILADVVSRFGLIIPFCWAWFKK